MLSVTIDRTSLDLPPLVISDYPDPDAPWYLPEDGVVEPGWSFRTTSAPESAYFPGDQPLAAVLDASTLPLAVYARPVGEATLGQVKAVLELAVAQFRYAITLTLDGEARSWVAFPSWPQWGPLDSGMGSRLARCSITVPINPALEV